MPPRGDRGPEDVVLKPRRKKISSGFKILELRGEVTVTTAPLNERDSPRPVEPEGDGFYPDMPPLQITAGPEGASFRLEFRPGGHTQRWPARRRALETPGQTLSAAPAALFFLAERGGQNKKVVPGGSRIPPGTFWHRGDTNHSQDRRLNLRNDLLGLNASADRKTRQAPCTIAR
jgi:hypothetical protein